MIDWFAKKKKTILNPFIDLFSAMDDLEVLSSVIITLFLIMAFFPGALAPYDPANTNLAHRLSPPSWSHPFGCDQFGRDILSRVIFGARTSLLTSLSVVFVAVIAGTGLGILAGYLGGFVDQLIMRTVDFLLAFPRIILALALVAVLGSSMFNIFLALSVTWWIQYARIVRSSVLQIKEKDFMDGARLMGAKKLYLMKEHILPNVLSPIIALATLDIGSSILHITSLSFLGLGAQPPAAEWGAMLKHSVSFMERAPQTMVFPGLFIFLTVLAFNKLGNGLRDWLDPTKQSSELKGGAKLSRFAKQKSEEVF